MAARDSNSSTRLDRYRDKRAAERTPEPFGYDTAQGAGQFVVQKHAATRMHYDLRLEHEGVLLSWAVPQGFSWDPSVKRLAVQTEDHPLEYADFEGVIPEGNYGAGAMIVWDKGSFVPLEGIAEGLVTGKLLVELRGYKLRGEWTLVRTKPSVRKRSSSLGAETKHEWLLIKHRDGWAREEDADRFDETSVLSGLTVEELGAGEDHGARTTEMLEELGAARHDLGAPEVELMLATVADGPFTRAGWLFELKYDGYRMLAEKRDGRAALYYRSGIVATDVFPEVARAVTALPFEHLVLDGEVTVPDETGKPDFSRLQKRGRLSRVPDIAAAAVALPAAYFCFDLLAFGDFDLRALPLEHRKGALRQLLPRSGSLQYADHVEERGEALYEQVVRMGLEGLVAKKAGARYRGGRSDSWRKIRAEKVDDFVVVGFTAPQGMRAGFGALHLAAYAGAAGEEGPGRDAGAGNDEDADPLMYVGRVGSGFTDRQLAELAAALEDSVIEDLADLGMTGTVPQDAESTWVEPELVAEVRYKEITGDGYLRQPVFLRLRHDKPPGECLLPTAHPPAEAGDDGHDPPAPAAATAGAGPGRIGGIGVGAPRLQLTNLDKVFWPEEGYTKGDLLDYYEAVGELLLPWLADRPLVLDRYPDGIEGKNFFQKDAPSFVPSWVRTTPIDEGEGKRNNYLICDGVEALLYIINLGAIPLHVWSSRIDDLERPDWCTLDLDPKEAPFTQVVEVARAVHAVCREIELPCYAKTSGKTGMHLLVPLARRFSHEQGKMLGELLARVVVAENPEIATVVRSPAGRGKRVYIDFVQNGRGRLIVAPYSARPMPGGTVSTPLRWSEVTRRLDFRRFTLKSLPQRIKRMKNDPCVAVLTDEPDLQAVLAKLAARLE
jgi:bifunctional non-homologous end joining protein LigD